MNFFADRHFHVYEGNKFLLFQQESWWWISQQQQKHVKHIMRTMKETSDDGSLQLKTASRHRYGELQQKWKIKSYIFCFAGNSMHIPTKMNAW